MIKTSESSKGNFYTCTPAELRKAKASDFKEGDVIKVSKYYIHIK